MNEIAFVLHNFPPSSYKHQRVLWTSMSFYSHFTIICLFIVPFLCSQKSSNLLITLSLSKYRGISWYFITAWNPFSFNNFFFEGGIYFTPLILFLIRTRFVRGLLFLEIPCGVVWIKSHEFSSEKIKFLLASSCNLANLYCEMRLK